MSLFTKETAVLFPVLCVLFIWFYRKERLFIKANITLMAGWMAAAVLWWILRSSAIADIINPDTIGLRALFQNYPTFAAILGKIFVPIKMGVLASFESLSILCGIFSLILLFVIVAFNALGNNAIINQLFIAAGYTYGPILGLFSFGMMTQRIVLDKYVLVVCLIAPLLSYLINSNAAAWLNGFEFGNMIIALNGVITFIGLWIISRTSSQKVLVEN